MMNIGPQELLLILLVALVVVGPRKLPELGRSIGKGLRELRKAQDEVRKTIQLNMDEERPTHRPSESAVPDATPPDDGSSAEGTPPVSGSDAAAAAASAGASDMSDVSRSLGRGIAELRRARTEIQRTFRVDLNEPHHARSAGPETPRRPPPKPTPATPEVAPEAATSDDVTGEPVTGSPPE